MLKNITCVIFFKFIHFISNQNWEYTRKFWKFYLYVQTRALYFLPLKNFAWKSRVADVKSSFLLKTIVYGRLEILAIGLIVRDYRARR